MNNKTTKKLYFLDTSQIGGRKLTPFGAWVLEALCDECGEILRFVRPDFSNDPLCWLHTCDKCGKSYWLDNKYPYPDYAVNTGKPLDIKTPAIKCEEAK